ncbi:hypothetical protein GOODEAATRI_034167 [Goodea atripinnis]|uniref:Uncharacterized protein n=1 Tax=Goodea atripinnis TaxID=208336 RepID=A0ABV0P2Q4_9TELE
MAEFSTQTEPNVINRTLFRLFHSKLTFSPLMEGGEGWLVPPAWAELHAEQRCIAVPLFFLQAGKTAPLGTLWNTVSFCRPHRERSSHACTFITPFMNEYRIHKQQFIPI